MGRTKQRGRLTIVGSGREVSLRPGDILSIGRGEHTPEHLGLGTDERLHQSVCTVTATETGWQLCNHGRWLCVDLKDLDGQGFDRIEPGQTRSVPWTRTGVEVSVGPTSYVKDFATAFPYHICFGRDLTIKHCGLGRCTLVT